MGMYNEVYKRCPKCESLNEIQISQVVLGFGGFHLDDPESMANLDIHEKKRLKMLVEKQVFHCDNCQNSYDVELIISKPQLACCRVEI